MHWHHIVLVTKLDRSVSFTLLWFCYMNPVTPCLYFASHIIWMAHIMASLTAHLAQCNVMWDKSIIRVSKKNKKRGSSGKDGAKCCILLSDELKPKRGRSMLEVLWLAVIQWHLRNDQIFFCWPLSVPYLNLLKNANVHCQSGKLLNKSEQLFSRESTHRICWSSFIWRKNKIIL